MLCVLFTLITLFDALFYQIFWSYENLLSVICKSHKVQKIKDLVLAPSFLLVYFYLVIHAAISMCVTHPCHNGRVYFYFVNHAAISMCVTHPCHNGRVYFYFVNHAAISMCVTHPCHNGRVYFYFVNHAAINMCVTHPCHNGGVCKNFQTYYVCVCRETWTGEHCDERTLTLLFGFVFWFLLFIYFFL